LENCFPAAIRFRARIHWPAVVAWLLLIHGHPKGYLDQNVRR
jgi:hypothetical protein